MKQIIIAVFLLITFASCRKCADCETTVYSWSGVGTGTTTKTYQRLCDDDLKNGEGTKTYITTTNGQTTNIQIVTKCN